MCDLKVVGFKVPACVHAVSGLHPTCESCGGVRVGKVRSIGPPKAGRAGQPGGLGAALQSKAGDPHFSLESGTSAPTTVE